MNIAHRKFGVAPVEVEQVNQTQLAANKFGIYAQNHRGKTVMVSWAQVYSVEVSEDGDAITVNYESATGTKALVVAGEDLHNWVKLTFALIGGTVVPAV